MGDEPGQTQRVHTHTVHIGAAGSGNLRGGGIGHRGGVGLTTCLGDQLGGTVGGATGGVGLVGVVQLDDLGAVEVGRGLLREVHHQHRGDAEVRCDEYFRAGFRGLHRAHPFQSGLVEATGTNDRVDPAVDEPLQVVHYRVGMGEVDDAVGPLHSFPIVVGVHARDEFHVVGGPDCRDDL